MTNQGIEGMKAIIRIATGLTKGDHQVKAKDGNKVLVIRLEYFMPRIVKGELPGIVSNVSNGIQGQVYNTHVPSNLELVGVPYVGSSTLAHSLAIDKVSLEVEV